MFRVEIIGNLGADAEIKEAQGSKFVSLRIAHSEKRKDGNGGEIESTLWINATMSDVESKIIPYLKSGIKVFVRGNGRLRVYSSPKLRQMVAGLDVAIREIELVGGSGDDVPRTLINPQTSEIYNVTKHYYCDGVPQGMKEDEYRLLIDQRGNEYMQNAVGFVVPKVVTDEDKEDTSEQKVNSGNE